ncbi:MAG: NAD-dependent dehydrogenase [Candidatus Alkanophagales archaeon MCA70_species_1]|nr:NAD-dependent dehydrogenase [Candidatus Alkanophaga volatiphilum]
MVEQKSGNIVSIGSDAGRMGEYMEGVYAGCKAAIIGLTKTLAREVGRYGIRLNVVCPGLTLPKDWEQEIGEKSLWRSKEMQERFAKPEVLEKIKKAYPLRKIGTPEDVAYAVLFLASDKCAGHITGQTLSVSGGYTMF